MRTQPFPGDLVIREERTSAGSHYVIDVFADRGRNGQTYVDLAAALKCAHGVSAKLGGRLAVWRETPDGAYERAIGP